MMLFCAANFVVHVSVSVVLEPKSHSNNKRKERERDREEKKNKEKTMMKKIAHRIFRKPIANYIHLSNVYE